MMKCSECNKRHEKVELKQTKRVTLLSSPALETPIFCFDSNFIINRAHALDANV